MIMRQTFLRSQFGKKKQLKKVWRRPRGLHSKLRKGIKNKGEKPNIGLKKPAAKKTERIFSVEGLKKAKGKEIIIGSGVGKKKKVDIMKEAEKNKIKVLNPPAKIKTAVKKEGKKK